MCVRARARNVFVLPSLCVPRVPHADQILNFNGKSEKRMTSYLQSSAIPVVLGPERTFHLTDRHQLMAALSLSNHQDRHVCVAFCSTTACFFAIDVTSRRRAPLLLTFSWCLVVSAAALAWILLTVSAVAASAVPASIAHSSPCPPGRSARPSNPSILGASRFVCPQLDLSTLSWSAFYQQMQAKGLVRLKDARGADIPLSDLPTSIAALTADDPYRSAMEYVSLACV